MPKKDRPMPKAMQVYLFKKRFGDLDAFTFADYVDEKLAFPENLWNLKKNHGYEILKARYEAGYTDEENARVFGWEESPFSQQDTNSEPEECDVEGEEDDLVSGDVEQNSEGWHIEQTDDWEIHSIDVEIEPHSTRSKGKHYLYGRIQLSVDPKWIGLTAKINVLVPKP